MGYKAAGTVYKLVFDDPEFDGLVVRVRASTIGARLEYNALVTDEEIIEWFPQYLVDWNLIDENDQPVPPTADGIKGVDEVVFHAILNAWRNAKRVKPDAPLDRPSPAGDPSQEASMPMAPLSASRAS